jgi:hypothetical protein
MAKQLHPFGFALDILWESMLFTGKMGFNKELTEDRIETAFTPDSIKYEYDPDDEAI